ncbi:hypothetical protein ACT6NV_11450 [Robiginitalea sp. IMCC44478]|uniref:hypothetical protein n=1 Tax=Robiginitalea sp. IMCC44478 TaxID=3459122 RepID=UPI004042A25C
MQKAFKITGRIVLSIAIIWGLLTLWVQQLRSGQTWEFPAENPKGAVLVVFNPDPIYNLDQQLALAYASTAQQQGWASSVATLAAADTINPGRFDLFVFFANTYNWSPDRPTKQFIMAADWLAGRSVVPVILGSGSTARSGRVLRELLQQQGANIVQTTDFWLMRPNDEARTDLGNVAVAKLKTAELARESLSRME